MGDRDIYIENGSIGFWIESEHRDAFLRYIKECGVKIMLSEEAYLEIAHVLRRDGGESVFEKKRDLLLNIADNICPVGTRGDFLTRVNYKFRHHRIRRARDFVAGLEIGVAYTKEKVERDYQKTSSDEARWVELVARIGFDYRDIGGLDEFIEKALNGATAIDSFQRLLAEAFNVPKQNMFVKWGTCRHVLFIACAIYAHTRVVKEADGKSIKKLPGFMDIMQTIYLPFCAAFVTNDWEFGKLVRKLSDYLGLKGRYIGHFDGLLARVGIIPPLA